MPGDQGPDDLRSLTYDTPPLDRVLAIAGSPEASLHVAADGFGGVDLVAKLVDLAPDGRASLITSGWTRALGGTATIRLAATAYRLPAGHRLRLSVAASDFPRTWPRSGSAELRHAGSSLRLPVLSAADAGSPVEPRRPSPSTERAPWSLESTPAWSITRDEVAGSVAVTSGGAERLRTPSGARLRLEHRATARATDGQLDDTTVDAWARIEIAMPDGRSVHVDARGHAMRDRQRYEGSVAVDGRSVLECAWGTGSS
jgi:hypothetical protein